MTFSDYCNAFPLKGGWENDETVEEAAVREAIEEAGVRGDLMVRNMNFLTLEFLQYDFLASVIS
jgi:8-oxo-dGTP pyrophosphatase MutT (NUDIX family)